MAVVVAAELDVHQDVDLDVRQAVDLDVPGAHRAVQVAVLVRAAGAVDLDAPGALAALDAGARVLSTVAEVLLGGNARRPIVPENVPGIARQIAMVIVPQHVEVTVAAVAAEVAAAVAYRAVDATAHAAAVAAGAASEDAPEHAAAVALVDAIVLGAEAHAMADAILLVLGAVEEDANQVVPQLVAQPALDHAKINVTEPPRLLVDNLEDIL